MKLVQVHEDVEKYLLRKKKKNKNIKHHTPPKNVSQSKQARSGVNSRHENSNRRHKSFAK